MNIFKLTLVFTTAVLLAAPSQADPTDLAGVLAKGSADLVYSFNGNSESVKIKNSSFSADAQLNNLLINEKGDAKIGVIIGGKTVDVNGVSATAKVRANNVRVGEKAKLKAGVVIGSE